MKATCALLIATTAFSFGQTVNKKVANPPKPDNWERSKECAAQAEKVVADWPGRTGAPSSEWSNHYSPKYNRCFVAVSSLQPSKDETIFPTTSMVLLLDAFERSRLASTCSAPVAHGADCGDQFNRIMRDNTLNSVSKKRNGKPFAEASSDEQDAVRIATDRIMKDTDPGAVFHCNIGGKAVDCAKAKEFITDHMNI